MFRYLSQLFFSEEPEDQELSDMGVGAGAEDINSEDGEVSDSDNELSEGDNSNSESDDEGNVYYADSDSESEDEVCCQAVMSKLILCGADHTVLKACSRKDTIQCECFKGEADSKVTEGEVCEPERKRSNSIH